MPNDILIITSLPRSLLFPLSFPSSLLVPKIDFPFPIALLSQGLRFFSILRLGFLNDRFLILICFSSLLGLGFL